MADDSGTGAVGLTPSERNTEMLEQKFADGTVVRLKSGGPKMTVVSYGKYNYSSKDSYKCRWFDEKNKLTESRFMEAELESAEDAQGQAGSWVDNMANP